MPSLLTTTKFALLFLSALGFYLTWYLLFHNGTQQLMVQVRDKGPHLLPGTSVPLKKTYVGIEAIDYQLTVLDLFFWEMVGGSKPGASLFCYHFAGQIFAGWGLLMVESLRGGNRGRAISYIAIWGIVLQNLTFAVIVPIYLILHLSSSPTVKSREPRDYALKLSNIYGIPVALFFGYAIPTVLMSLPAPGTIDFSTKQNLMAIWQFFPLWISIVQAIVEFLIAFFNQSTSEDSASVSRMALRSVYAVLIAVAGVNQLSTLSIVALSELFPSKLASSYVGTFNLSTVFLPRGITPATQMSTIADGALMLLQYDNYTGSFAIALWATVLAAGAYREQREPAVNYVNVAFYGFITLVLTGPLGYAVACLWARDELVFENANEEKKAQ